MGIFPAVIRPILSQRARYLQRNHSVPQCLRSTFELFDEIQQRTGMRIPADVVNYFSLRMCRNRADLSSLAGIVDQKLVWHVHFNRIAIFKPYIKNQDIV